MTAQLLPTPHGRIAYEVFGHGGRSFVAIPGIGDTRGSYRHLARRLADAGHTVYAMDLRGHGDADTSFGSYRSEDIGDDVVALMESLDLHDAVLLGNSVGAAASVHASLASDRASHLVLLSGFVSDPPNFGLLRWMLTLLFAWPWGAWAWSAYRRTLFATLPADEDTHHAAVAANLREPGRLAAVRAMMCASKADIERRLPEVRRPALIAMGAADPDFPDPVAEAQRQQELLGGRNEVVMIDGAGHYPQSEQPDVTCGHILAFVGGAAHGA